MSGVNFNDWLHAFWDEVGVPHTLRNAYVGMAWVYTESGDPDGRSNTGRWNPLGSTWELTAQTAPSGIASTDFNSVPVQNYATMQDGLYATRRVLQQNCCGFPLILKRLRSKHATAHRKLVALENSDWGTEGLIFAVYDDIKNGAYEARASTLVARSY